MPATIARRLPGFRFEAPPAAPAEVLPRMDIAVFVGFAASGPLHTPVKVEDEAEFQDIFGTDTPLAWDPEMGEPIYAYLPAAVRGFFRNGGQRCWIIRVAKSSEPNTFPVPGLVAVTFDENAAPGKNGLGALSPAFARARSQGRWSDGLLVSAILESQPVQVAAASLQDHTALLASNLSQSVVPGDLIRLQYGERGLFMLLAVESAEQVLPEDLESPPATQGTPGLLTRVGARQAVFLAASGMKQPSAGVATVRFFDSPSEHRTCAAYVPQVDGGSGGPPAELVWPTPAGDPNVTLYLDLAFDQAPPLGSSLLALIGGDMLWLTVEQSTVLDLVGSPPGQKVSVTGPAWWASTQPFPSLSPPVEPVGWTGERLSFGFRVQLGDQTTLSLDQLGFAPEQPRYWNGLPNDEDLYPAIGAQASGSPPALWLEIARPRFPLAGVKGETTLFLPINMPLIEGPLAGANAVSGAALSRDGLDEFKLDLFLDTRLSGVEVRDLAGEADFLRSQMPAVHQLQGIHAAFGVEEATIIAVPDAVHRGWSSLEPEPPATQPSSPLERPEWWHFLPCDPPPVIPRTKDPPRGHFLACDSGSIAAPVLRVEGDEEPIVSQTGTFTLSWPQAIAGGVYTLQEATMPDFGDAVPVYSGSGLFIQMTGRPAGNYFYRVRVISERRTSDWSNSVGVRVVAADFWLAKPRGDYSPEILLGIHRTLLRTCAARADALAVLALPDHYLTEKVTGHVQALAPSRPALNGFNSYSDEEKLAPRLTFGEESALSYGALYHPWGQAQTADNQIRRAPPDGMACGILARRALERGSWIAPANESWRGLVALTPFISEDDRTLLQQAQVNLVRQEPRGFLTLSADTLSTDADLRPIHVRRLLILLRRLALALGPTYVFEPNDDTFRRLVERNFEALLEDMFRAGAFAGDTPANSFQVVTGEALNTPESVELGRFIVELKVAPAQALRFVTIRLIQAGNGNLSVVEG